MNQITSLHLNLNLQRWHHKNKIEAELQVRLKQNIDLEETVMQKIH